MLLLLVVMIQSFLSMSGVLKEIIGSWDVAAFEAALVMGR
jgi:hypothetical protein